MTSFSSNKRVCSHVDDFNNRKTFLTSKLLKQGYRYHKLRQYNICLNILLQQGLPEPVFYGDLVYKFKKIVLKPNFSDQLKKD